MRCCHAHSATRRLAPGSQAALFARRSRNSPQAARRAARPRRLAIRCSSAPPTASNAHNQLQQQHAHFWPSKVCDGDSEETGGVSLPSVESLRFTGFDYDIFIRGEHEMAFLKLGAHLARNERTGEAGVHFAMWAPGLNYASVIGDFNDWDRGATPMQVSDVGHGTIWEVFVPGIGEGAKYMLHVSDGSDDGVDKSDPFAFQGDVQLDSKDGESGIASIVCDVSKYQWQSSIDTTTSPLPGSATIFQGNCKGFAEPISIYELHLGSFRRKGEEQTDFLTYDEHAAELVRYLKEMKFTHVEFMPVATHPFYGSWGYQVTNYFSPTSRYGSPAQLMMLIDSLHAAGIKVIMDWVPAHFPVNVEGLALFNQSPLYEYADPRRGFHPEWNTCVFDYSRGEVRSFLLSNAMFWCQMYRVDGLRVDAVASMIFYHYCRKEGEWLPNEDGTPDNWDAVLLLRTLNQKLHASTPWVLTIAEEAYDRVWHGVSRKELLPIRPKALGFDYKWDMGWMNDLLAYFGEKLEHRKFHQDRITFRPVYSHHENFVLSLSHDEVVYGKKSLLSKMPGDELQQFSGLRALLGYMWACPGKKLLFMGQEFGQTEEWDWDKELDWDLLQDARHAQVKAYVAELNDMYRNTPALYHLDCNAQGFAWLDKDNAEQSVLAFVRQGFASTPPVICIFNFGASQVTNYSIGCPYEGPWECILSSSETRFGGTGDVIVEEGTVAERKAFPKAAADWERGGGEAAWPYTLCVQTLPPLSASFLRMTRPVPLHPVRFRCTCTRQDGFTVLHNRQTYHSIGNGHVNGSETTSDSGDDAVFVVTSASGWGEQIPLQRKGTHLLALLHHGGTEGTPRQHHVQYERTVLMPPGTHSYRFRIDGVWSTTEFVHEEESSGMTAGLEGTQPLDTVATESSLSETEDRANTKAGLPSVLTAEDGGEVLRVSVPVAPAEGSRCAAAVPTVRHELRFEVLAAENVEDVSAACEFVGWSFIQLQRLGILNNPNGNETVEVWAAEVDVPVGRWQYKLVINGEWLDGDNSVLEVPGYRYAAGLLVRMYERLSWLTCPGLRSTKCDEAYAVRNPQSIWGPYPSIEDRGYLG